MSAPLELRPEVAIFAQVMEARLRSKDASLGSGAWRQHTWESLMDNLTRQVSGLRAANVIGDPQKIAKKAADVANLAMMVADRATSADESPSGAEVGQDPHETVPPVPLSYSEIGQRIGAMVERKQREYGDSFHRSVHIIRVLYPNGIPPEAYPEALALIRVIDKQFRIASGKQGDENPWADIVGYALLATADDPRFLP